MAQATILGAGYMGSAMSFALASAGVQTRLWGTWLDDELIEASRNGVHPRLKTRLPESVRLYSSENLAEAVDGADFIFIGVSSEGFVPVFTRLVEVLRRPLPIFTMTKGFSQLHGEVGLTDEIAGRIFGARFAADEFHWTSIGGPVKAYELARAVPSAAIYATVSPRAVEMSGSIATDYYRVAVTSDVTGVQLCSALKNVYSMAIGLCDGLYDERFPRNYHNLSSLLFNQGIKEMAAVVEAAGGSAATAHDLAGVGDLYVTAQSGKNQRFGYLIGKGMAPEEAYRHMFAQGELAEGYPALKAGEQWLMRNHPDTRGQLPLFATLYRITCEGAPVESSLRELVTSSL